MISQCPNGIFNVLRRFHPSIRPRLEQPISKLGIRVIESTI